MKKYFRALAAILVSLGLILYVHNRYINQEQEIEPERLEELYQQSNRDKEESFIESEKDEAPVQVLEQEDDKKDKPKKSKNVVVGVNKETPTIVVDSIPEHEVVGQIADPQEQNNSQAQSQTNEDKEVKQPLKEQTIKVVANNKDTDNNKETNNNNKPVQEEKPNKVENSNPTTNKPSISPLDKKIEQKYHGFSNGFSKNPVMAYIVDKIRNYDFNINLKEARRDLDMPNLSINHLLGETSQAVMQNAILGDLHGGGSFSEDGINIDLNPAGISQREFQAQRDYMKGEIVKILDKYDFTGKSDYEKSVMINNIVIDYLSYDNILGYYIDPFGFDNIKEEAEAAGDGALQGVLKYGSLYQALKTKKAVCAGYAELYNVLAHAVGLDSIYVSGMINTGREYMEDHAWNWVMLDGHYYLVDTTWNDSGFELDLNNEDNFWLHLPIDYVRDLRGHEVYYYNFLTAENEGKSFDYTYFARKGMLVKKAHLKETMFRMIEELKERNPKDPNEWTFSLFVYDLKDKQAAKYIKEINEKLNSSSEVVDIISNVATYTNYLKLYGGEDMTLKEESQIDNIDSLEEGLIDGEDKALSQEQEPQEAPMNEIIEEPQEDFVEEEILQ